MIRMIFRNTSTRSLSLSFPLWFYPVWNQFRSVFRSLLSFLPYNKSTSTIQKMFLLHLLPPSEQCALIIYDDLPPSQPIRQKMMKWIRKYPFHSLRYVECKVYQSSLCLPPICKNCHSYHELVIHLSLLFWYILYIILLYYYVIMWILFVAEY